MKMAGAKAMVGMLLFVVVCVLIAISTATDFWSTFGPIEGEHFSVGLWRSCAYTNGEKVCQAFTEHLRAFMYGARACMVLSCILALVALVCTALIFIAERTKLRMVAVGIMYAGTGLLVLVGTAWFASVYSKDAKRAGVDFSFGYSIILGWVSVPFAIVSGLLIVSQAYFGSQQRYTTLP
ncbi:peripheral myelin protein 22-like [Ptychodera flava]|uniref:peripheral myelin protein 22-like n=1 Tax=Ptychodera flava TaxID=63121 RepID=UPI00396A50B0